MTTPLFLAILCYICKISLQKNKTLDLIYETETVEALIGSFWRHMIRIKETGKMDIDFASGLFDKDTSEDIRWMFSGVAKMSFDYLEKGESIFTEQIMRRTLGNKYLKPSYLSKLGPVDVFEGGMKFIHKLFQEYCAAYHMTEDKGVLMEMFNLCNLRHEKISMFEKFRKALVFAVAISPQLLSYFPGEKYKIPLLVSKDGESRFDLSFESELVNGCKDRSIAESFVSRIMKALIDSVKTVDTLPDINLKAYKELLTYMSHEECLMLLQRAFPPDGQHDTNTSSNLDMSSTPSTHAPLIQHPNGSDDLVISDPIILAALVSVNLGKTKRLSLKNVTPSTLSHLIDDQV